MQITIKRDGETFGPYTLEEVRNLLANGTLQESELAQPDGSDDWVQVGSIPELQTASSAEAKSAQSQENGPTTFPCSDCGGDLIYSPGQSKMECPYCGAEVDCPTPTGEVLEHDFESQLASLESGAATTVVAEATCDACGAENQLDANQTSGDCAFCGTPFVQQPQTTNTMRPQAVLPFSVTRDEGLGHFRDWIKGLWFAPNKLKEFARDVQKLKGLYLPHWTYDSGTTTDYMGMRGIHRTEYYTNSEGERQSRTVTDWYPAAGRVWLNFDDVLVPASDTLPRKYVDELEPWDLPALTPYEDAYLSGFQSESYSVDLRTGFDIAKVKMEPDIEDKIRWDIGGDEQRIHHKNTYYSDITFKYILLPVWISAYRFKDKTYQFLVNARTGEVQGERPWSWIKITLAVLAALAVIGTIIYFANEK